MKHILILICCLCPLCLHGQDILSTLSGMYTAKKGETWESVAADHDISVEELRAANPDVRRKLRKGTLLAIPALAAGSASGVATFLADRPGAASSVRTSISDLKVGVLLPFSEERMVEFYRGFLMAADSVRRRGINLDIHAWDCGTSKEQAEALLPDLDGLDVVFGPASAMQIQPVAESCTKKGIRLVLPFWSGQMTQNTPLAYNVTAPATVLYDAAVRKMMAYFPDKNYIVVHSGSPDNRGKILTDALTQALAQHKTVPRTLELEGDDFAYESAFNQYRDNMIVLDNSSPRSLVTLLSRLKEFRRGHSQYRLSLVGYTEWQDETYTLSEDFFTFDTYIVTPYYYNVSDEKAGRFQSAYEKNFRTAILHRNPSYAALGFDVGCYFLTGISNLGDTFEQMQIGIQQDPLQNWFCFARADSQSMAVNTFVQFIHFAAGGRTELIR